MTVPGTPTGQAARALPGRLTPRQSIVVAALLFSTGGIAIKACSLSAWQVAGFRSGMAALVLLMLPAARRAWSWRTALVALPYGATVILFTLANKMTTAANAIFLQDTAPLYVLLLGPWLLAERIRGSDVPFMLALGCGMLLLFADAGMPAVTAPQPVLGNALAMIAGVTWAFTLLGLRWLARRGGEAGGESLAGAAAGNLVACCVALPWAFPVVASTPTDWLIVVYLGVFQIGLAYLLITTALPHVPALEVSLLLLLEPVLSPIWAWLVLGEAPGTLALAGGAVILLATAIRALRTSHSA
jgi:drug/metabolite transporter (DMT)-like permease